MQPERGVVFAGGLGLGAEPVTCTVHSWRDLAPRCGAHAIAGAPYACALLLHDGYRALAKGGLGLC